MPDFEEANCLGFVLGKNEWLIPASWGASAYDRAWNKATDAGIEGKEKRIVIDEFLADFTAEDFCKAFGFKEIQTTPEEAPVGTVVMKVGSFGLFSDFHFAIKGIFDGEVVWLHKPGKTPVDIMFDPEHDFDEKYRSKPRYFISVQ